ncbi:MAG: GH3 auxin-responsive promoter family protein, partial [bacterium]|nr:GH3 auxin-responsive promoter family protein [bacterium]
MIQTILQLIYRTKQGKEDNSFGGQNNFIKKYFTKGIAAFVIFFDMLYKSAIAIGITFYEIFATKGETLERKNLFSVLQNLLIRIVIHVRGKILWDTFRFSALDCRKTQLAVLESILAENKETVYGREYGFEYINSSGNFQKHIPVNSYEDLSPYLDRMCNGEEDVLVKGKPVIYATTSGTTGKPKFIPVTSST